MPNLLDVGAGRIVVVSTFYKVTELLGVGRYSEVYKAFDSNSQTDVALKIYTGFDSSAYEMAKAEEAALAQVGKLNSEYFPRIRKSVRDRIQKRNHPILVLELASYTPTNGTKGVVFSLKDVVPTVGDTSKPKPDTEFWAAESLVHWIIHLAQGVKQLHQLEMIHRDLKPANILVKRAAGQSASLPLFLDFNSAASLEAHSSRGTPRYLPPEVTSGTRSTPAFADDLWAIAMIGWEIIHGQDSSPENTVTPHEQIAGSIPEGLVDVLRQALQVAPQERYKSAEELVSALESAVLTGTDDEHQLTTDEVARARTSMSRIRLAMWQALAPPGELVVPKEVEDGVTTAIAWSSEEDTQSLDLIAELVRFGPLAIPVCLQQGYRVPSEKPAYSDIVRAVEQLAKLDFTVAVRSIDMYALSSNMGVRALCWDVCEALRYFPEIMLDSLKGDEGLLLPKERLRIADLCIRFSTKKSAVLALVKYMCREYILDIARYRELRTTVARRMHELQLRDEPATNATTPQKSLEVRQLITPLLIAQDTEQCVWRELREFQKIPKTAREEMEKGLIELMGEAYAATGAAGLTILKTGKVPRNTGASNLPVFRRFAAKLAASNPEAVLWLKKLAQHDFDAQKALEAVVPDLTAESASPDELLREYLLSGDSKLFDRLRFWKTAAVLQRLKARLEDHPSPPELTRTMELLKGYQSRQRPAVVDVLLTHWPTLSKADYGTAVEVLTRFEVPPAFRLRARETLNRELSGPHSDAARKGLEQLLRERET
jgi:serine/threonine protein kinase